MAHVCVQVSTSSGTQLEQTDSLESPPSVPCEKVLAPVFAANPLQRIEPTQFGTVRSKKLSAYSNLIPYPR